MTLVDRIRALTNWQPEDYLPLRVDGRVVGHVARDAVARIEAHPQVFDHRDHEIRFREVHDTPEKRTAAFMPVARAWEHEGWIMPLRGEGYPVVERWGEAPVFVVDRSAAARLGTPGFGVHLDGWCWIADVPTFWIGHRAKDKTTWPDHLDHLVAGGQPLGLSLRENLEKEAQEEAGMGPELLDGITPRGALRYCVSYEGGLRNDTIVTYDLELPIAFEPKNEDGEISSFERVPLSALLHLLRGTARFKPNVALVLIDLIESKGWLEGDAELDAVRDALRPLRLGAEAIAVPSGA